MAHTWYTFLLLAGVITATTAERVHGEGKQPKELVDCDEFVWDEETIQRRKLRGMDVGDGGALIESSFLMCLTDLGFEAVHAPNSSKELQACSKKTWNVSNPTNCSVSRREVVTLTFEQGPSSPIIECQEYGSYRELKSCFNGPLRGKPPAKYMVKDITSAETFFVKSG